MAVAVVEKEWEMVMDRGLEQVAPVGVGCRGW